MVLHKRSVRLYCFLAPVLSFRVHGKVFYANLGKQARWWVRRIFQPSYSCDASWAQNPVFENVRSSFLQDAGECLRRGKRSGLWLWGHCLRWGEGWSGFNQHPRDGRLWFLCSGASEARPTLCFLRVSEMQPRLIETVKTCFASSAPRKTTTILSKDSVQTFALKHGWAKLMFHGRSFRAHCSKQKGKDCQSHNQSQVSLHSVLLLHHLLRPSLKRQQRDGRGLFFAELMHFSSV